MITFEVPRMLHDHTDGQGTLTISGSTVGDCLGGLCQEYSKLKPEIFDDNGELLIRWTLLLNKKMIYQRPLQHPLEEGDTFTLLPLVAGG